MIRMTGAASQGRFFADSDAAAPAAGHRRHPGPGLHGWILLPRREHDPHPVPAVHHLGGGGVGGDGLRGRGRVLRGPAGYSQPRCRRGEPWPPGDQCLALHDKAQ